MIVADASAVLQILLRTPAAQAVQSWLLMPGQEIHAPHLIDLEVAHVLRKYATANPAEDDGYGRALTEWLALPVKRHAHEPYVARIWALRQNVSAYDAAYIALAEALQAPLITRDQRLAGSVGHQAQIKLI